MNKFKFVVYFKSAVTFFHGNCKELLGVKGPPTNSKTIISLCNQVVLVKGKYTCPLSCKKNIICRKKICQGPMSIFDGNMVVSAGMAHIQWNLTITVARGTGQN